MWEELDRHKYPRYKPLTRKKKVSKKLHLYNMMK